MPLIGPSTQIDPERIESNLYHGHEVNYALSVHSFKREDARVNHQISSRCHGWIEGDPEPVHVPEIKIKRSACEDYCDCAEQRQYLTYGQRCAIL